jgi:flagellar export protein FliJ
MKKFQFRLNAFLGYRKHLEQEARQAVALTRSKIDECRQRIVCYQEQQAKNQQELHEKMISGIDAARISVYISYHQRLETVLHNEGLLLANFQKELAHKQKLLKQRSIEKKAIENLKQRSKEEYYKEIDTILQKETEDMVIMRKIRENMK